MRIAVALFLLVFPALGHAAPSRAKIRALLDDPRTASLFKDERVLKSAPFKRWLAQSGKSAKLGADQLWADYLQSSFAKYDGSALTPLREKSLDASLRTHGAKPPAGLHGQKLLAWVSAQNRERLVGALHHQSRPELRDAERAVNDLSLQFLHNSTLIDGRPSTTMVSSEQLIQMGYPGGLHSQKPFNQSFLKTGDNVYFWADVRRKNVYPASTSEYGWSHFYVKHDYAAQNGFVSFRLMLPEELMSFAETNAPQKARSLANAMRRVLPPEQQADASTMIARLPDVNKFIAAHQKSFGAIRSKLHLLDFTVSDFETVVRSQLIHELDQLQKKDPVRLAQVVNDLRVGDSESVTSIVKELVFRPLKLPEQFEMKIPVAMPPEAAIKSR